MSFTERRRSITEILEAAEIRLAKIDDAPELAKLFQTFFKEARYQDRGVVYSLGKSEAWLKSVIGRGAVPHLLALAQGEIVGVCAYELDGTFCERPVAVMHTIFVVKEHRRSAMGRMLIALAVDMARGEGACAFHAPIASGMDEQQSLINLFAKGGFEPIGVILGRRL